MINESGIGLQLMDGLHAALVNMFLRADGFEHYHCDVMSLCSVNLSLLDKILTRARDDDLLTLNAHESKVSSVSLLVAKENYRPS